jgi:hypothetical protein
MKRLVGIAVALVAALVLAGSASAQGGKKGKGGGDFGRIMLLANKDVQKDLKLGDEQVAKIKELSDKQAEIFKGFQDLDKEEKAARFKQMKEIGADFKKVIDDLTPEQTTRLKQLQIQQQGAGALFNPMISEKLDLSEEQQSKLKEMFKDSMQKRFALFKEFKEDKEGTTKKLAELTKELNAEAMKILSDDQQTKFKEMQGPAFKGTLPPAFGGGFGGMGMGMGMGGNETSRIEAVPAERRRLLL